MRGVSVPGTGREVVDSAAGEPARKPVWRVECRTRRNVKVVKGEGD
jgi:hypothetical protein